MNHEDGAGALTVKVRGRVSAAEHVYAHDRVAMLRPSERGVGFRGVIQIDARDAEAHRVVATAELEVGGAAVSASSDGPTTRGAVDRLSDLLQERICDLDRDVAR